MSTDETKDRSDVQSGEVVDFQSHRIDAIAQTQAALFGSLRPSTFGWSTWLSGPKRSGGTRQRRFGGRNSDCSTSVIGAVLSLSL